MRALPLLLVLGGCAPPPVQLTFTGQTTTQVGVGYENTAAGVVSEVDGELVLTSMAGGAVFRIAVDPIRMPLTVNVGDSHLTVEYSVQSIGWASNSGSVTFSSLVPYQVTFNAMGMRPATSGAKGEFVLDGNATFR